MKKIFRRIFVNRSQITNNLGFTLIELLIVVTVIIIFSGLSLAYYNNFTQEQQLKTEARKLIDVLELAKKKAASGDLSGLDCYGGFRGYEVNIQPNNYSLNLRCTATPTSQLVAGHNFPNANIFVQSGTGSIWFYQLTSGTNLSSTRTLRVKNNLISGSNQCLSVTISTIGIIDFTDNFFPC